MPVRAIFFDAGNTLLFPNLERMLMPLREHHSFPTFQQLCAAEREAKEQLDAAILAGTPSTVDAAYWETYFSHLLYELGLSNSELRAKLVAAARTSMNWDRLLPGTHEVLEKLKVQYQLGIISNADGHIYDLLEKVGLSDYFVAFTDSKLVGYEKPDLRIFAAALQAVGVTASESMYVGDIYSVDYLGATGAGMQAILMDVSGTYRENGLHRIESLAELTTVIS